METYNKLKSAIQTGDITTFEFIMEQVKTISENAYDNNYGEMLDYMTKGAVWVENEADKGSLIKITQWEMFEDLYLGTDILIICGQIDELNELN